MKTTAEYRVAIHEAGHVYVAWWFGRKFGKVEFTPDDPHSIACVRQIKKPNGTADMVLARIMLAGPIAQGLLTASGRMGKLTGPDSQWAFRASVSQCSGRRSAQLCLAWLKYDTRQIVKNGWQEIVRVAESLIKKRRLTSRQVVAMLNRGAKNNYGNGRRVRSS